MANLNKVMLIGRLTRDPEVRTFSSGGKVAAFGFAVNNSKKNTQTGQWEDDPVFLDLEAFNRPSGQGQQLADRVEQSLHKGNQVFIEGHLKLDQWTAQDGQKRQKIKIVVDGLQFLEPRGDGSSRGSSAERRPMNQPASGSDEHYEAGEPPAMDAPPPNRAAEDIPF